MTTTGTTTTRTTAVTTTGTTTTSRGAAAAVRRRGVRPPAGRGAQPTPGGGRGASGDLQAEPGAADALPSGGSGLESGTGVGDDQDGIPVEAVEADAHGDSLRGVREDVVDEDVDQVGEVVRGERHPGRVRPGAAGSGRGPGPRPARAQNADPAGDDPASRRTRPSGPAAPGGGLHGRCASIERCRTPMCCCSRSATSGSATASASRRSAVTGRAQPVREVADRGALGAQQLGGAVGEPVEGAGQLLGLLGAAHPSPGAQVALAQPVRRAGHLEERLADPPAEPPGDREGQRPSRSAPRPAIPAHADHDARRAGRRASRSPGRPSCPPDARPGSALATRRRPRRRTPRRARARTVSGSSGSGRRCRRSRRWRSAPRVCGVPRASRSLTSPRR